MILIFKNRPGSNRFSEKAANRTPSLGLFCLYGCFSKQQAVVLDRAIGNLQQWLIGTYHGVSHNQLQVYLDEFVFRHNRRKQPMAAFQTLLGLGTGQNPIPYDRIRGAKDLPKLPSDV